MDWVSRLVDIDDMEAGRDMDMLVAEKVMGYEWRAFKAAHSNPVKWLKDLYPPGSIELTWPIYPGTPSLEGLPYENSLHITQLRHFSTANAPAMDVAQQLREWGWLVTIKWMPRGFYYMMQGSLSEYDGPSPDKPGFKGKTIVDVTWMGDQGEDGFNRHERPFSSTHVGMSSSDELPHAVCKAALKAAVVMERMKAEEEGQGQEQDSAYS